MTPLEIYNPNTPTPDQLISNSQQQMQQNFRTIYDDFAVNHIALDAGSGAGNHNVIQLAQQESQFQTNAGEVSVYAKNVTSFQGHSVDQLFMRYQGNQTEFPFSMFQPFTFSNAQSDDICDISTWELGCFLWADNNSGYIHLIPNVKNVVSLQFCGIGAPPAGIQPGTSPNIELVNSGGVFTGVNIEPFPYYYFGVGNI